MVASSGKPSLSFPAFKSNLNLRSFPLKNRTKDPFWSILLAIFLSKFLYYKTLSAELKETECEDFITNYTKHYTSSKNRKLHESILAAKRIAEGQSTFNGIIHKIQFI